MVRYKNDETNFKLAIWKTEQPQYLVTVPKVLIDRLNDMEGLVKGIELVEGSKLILDHGKLFLIMETEPVEAEDSDN